MKDCMLPTVTSLQYLLQIKINKEHFASFSFSFLNVKIRFEVKENHSKYL